MRFCIVTLIAAFAATPAMACCWPYVVYADPTDRYDHGVLGDAIEYGALELRSSAGSNGIPDSLTDRVVLPESRVFEDIAPRIADLGGDVADKVVVVESHQDLGAQLAVYRFDAHSIRKVAATRPIGQRNRWLAPAAIADFDGDGTNDIAYVETPHLSGTLKIVSLRGNALEPITMPRPGFSNHRIGEDFITSGVRDCDGVAEMLLPNLGWTTLLAARLENGEITARALPFPPSREGIEAAARCDG